MNNLEFIKARFRITMWLGMQGPFRAWTQDERLFNEWVDIIQKGGDSRAQWFTGAFGEKDGIEYRERFKVSAITSFTTEVRN